jgi:hypothetical protein
MREAQSVSTAEDHKHVILQRIKSSASHVSWHASDIEPARLRRLVESRIFFLESEPCLEIVVQDERARVLSNARLISRVVPLFKLHGSQVQRAHASLYVTKQGQRRHKKLACSSQRRRGEECFQGMGHDWRCETWSEAKLDVAYSSPGNKVPNAARGRVEQGIR